MAPLQGRPHQGRGRFTNGCRGHDNDRGGGHSSGRRRGNGHAASRSPPSGNQAAFITWRKDIPYSRKNGPLPHSTLGLKRLKEFMTAAQCLIELRDDAIRHEVITNLASEGGLMRVAEISGTNLMTLQYQAQNDFLERIVLPFFRTMTNPDVLSSLLLEKAVGDIYVFVFGPHGQRGTRLFESCANFLQQLLNQSPTNSIHPAASTVLAALLKVLECNQGASLKTEFHHVIDVLQACLDYQPETFKGTLLEQGASKNMLTVRRHLKYGESVQPLDVAAVHNEISAFSFELSQDGPGLLSAIGPRHDNDHEAIQHIKILPTAQEIRCPRSEYLPTKDCANWHIPGIRGLVAQQFRLLREDTVGQLRNYVYHTMGELINSNITSKSEKPRNVGLRVYKYLLVALSYFFFAEQQKQLIVVATFDQPQHLQNVTSSVRQTWWENSKQLQVDSLVSWVDSEENALFFSISARGGFKASGYGNPQPKQAGEEEKPEESVSTLWSDPRKAFVTLRIIDLDNPALVSVLGRDWKLNQTQKVLVEFPGILLPSFQPTLEALQRMSQTPSIPFSHLLLPNCKSNNRQIAWPAYATQPGFAFDMRSITQDGSHLYLSRNNDFDHAALKARTTLDDAQCTSLIGALSCELALMQGPPGTGKSFVAIQAVKVLLECRLRAQLNPIICV